MSSGTHFPAKIPCLCNWMPQLRDNESSCEQKPGIPELIRNMKQGRQILRFRMPSGKFGNISGYLWLANTMQQWSWHRQMIWDLERHCRSLYSLYDHYISCRGKQPEYTDRLPGASGIQLGTGMSAFCTGASGSPVAGTAANAEPPDSARSSWTILTTSMIFCAVTSNNTESDSIIRSLRSTVYQKCHHKSCPGS